MKKIDYCVYYTDGHSFLDLFNPFSSNSYNFFLKNVGRRATKDKPIRVNRALRINVLNSLLNNLLRNH